MTTVMRFELILVLLAVIVGLELLARRLRMPPAAAFILGGIALAMIPGTPDLVFDPDLAMVLFLPPLLLASAFFTSWRDFRANLGVIFMLAVGAVGFTTLAVGVVAHWVEPSLPWAACFALGAIVSPPDSVAAKAVLQRLTLPPRLALLLEAESLVNDASGLVLYRFAVAAALTGAFNLGEASLAFGALAVGGVAVGVLCGLASVEIMRRMRANHLVIVTSFLAAWAAYIGAEAVEASGVLSTVACGLVIGWRQHMILSAATRMQARAVWEVVVFVLESLVFIVIGLSLRGVLERLDQNPLLNPHLVTTTLAIVATVIVSRFVYVFPTAYLGVLSNRLFGRKGNRPPTPAVLAVMSWAGMRGVVSLAAAVALPEAFPGRDFILAVTFAVILTTVLIQGATLAPLIKLLRVDKFHATKTETLSGPEARNRVAIAQLAAVEKRSAQPDGGHRHPRLVEQYGYRTRATKRFSEETETLLPARHEHFSVVLDAVTAGRSELLRLHRAGEIHDSVLHAIEHELDLEELTARRVIGED